MPVPFKNIGGNDEKFSIQNLLIYASALSADQVRDLSLWSEYYWLRVDWPSYSSS